MNAFLANRAVRRKGVAYIALLLASMVMVAVSSNPLVRDLQHGIAFAFKPVQVAVDGVAGNIRSITTTITEIDQLRKQNAALQSQNEQLEAENRAALEIRRENELLTGLLQLRNGLEYKTQAVSVIARESSEARRALVIDRGSDDGIKVGQVVITSGGALAGRVTEVASSFAYVVLISDSTSTVVGQLLSSAATGVVRGQLAALVMQDVDSSVDVALGEEVFTAGIELAGGIRSPFPKGLLIGRVADVTSDPNEVVQTVFLEPAAPLGQLEFLLVITNYEGGIPAPGEPGGPCKPTDGGTLPDSDEPCSTPVPTTKP